MGSILDFASKRKRPIAVYGATFVLMAVFVAASAGHKTAVEDVGEVWGCAKAAHLSPSGDIEAAIEADIEAVHGTWDEFSSCKKAVEMVEKLDAKYHLSEKLAAKYHLSEKWAAELLKQAEKDTPAASKVLQELAEKDSPAALNVLDHLP